MKLEKILRRMARYADEQNASGVTLTAYSNGRVRVSMKDSSGTQATFIHEFLFTKEWHRIPRSVKAIFKKRKERAR